MNSLRIALFFLVAIGTAASRCGASDLAHIFLKHPVWIREGAVWEQDPAELNESWSATAFLYFGRDGKFGVFSGIVLKQRKRLALSEGDGEKISSGTWRVKDQGVQLEYRLISLYKVMVPVGQSLPSVPGSIEQAEASVEPHARHLRFKGETYEAITGFNVSDLNEHLRRHEEQASHKMNER